MSWPAKKPVQSTGGDADARGHRSLMLEMGSETGDWSPLPDDHILAYLHPNVDLSANEVTFIFCVVYSCCVFKKGGREIPRNAWGKTDKGEPLILARIAERCGWETQHAAKYAEAPLAYGFVRKNDAGIYGVGAKIETKLSMAKKQDIRQNFATCTSSIPKYLSNDIKRLNDFDRKEFLTGWAAEELAAKKRLADARMELYELDRKRKARLCEKFGLILKEGAKQREESDAPSVRLKVEEVTAEEAPELLVQVASEVGRVQVANGALYNTSGDPVQGFSAAHIRKLSSEAEELATAPPETKPKNSEDELTLAITEVIERSSLKRLSDKPIDGKTIGNIRQHLQRLSADHPRQVKAVLEILEEKCRFLANHPADAASKTWGWIVGVVRGEVTDRIGDPVDSHTVIAAAAAQSETPQQHMARLEGLIEEHPHHLQISEWRAALEVLRKIHRVDAKARKAGQR